MDMVDTADRAWNFSVAVQRNDSELQLVQMKIAPERQSEPVLPAYSLGQSNAFPFDVPHHARMANWSSQKHRAKVAFVVEEFPHGSTIAYYPDPKLQEDPYYLYDNDGTVCSLGTSCASPSSGSTRSVHGALCLGLRGRSAAYHRKLAEHGFLEYSGRQWRHGEAQERAYAKVRGKCRASPEGQRRKLDTRNEHLPAPMRSFIRDWIVFKKRHRQLHAMRRLG